MKLRPYIQRVRLGILITGLIILIPFFIQGCVSPLNTQPVETENMQSTPTATPESTSTPTRLPISSENTMLEYFPHQSGDTWIYTFTANCGPNNGSQEGEYKRIIQDAIHSDSIIILKVLEQSKVDVWSCLMDDIESWWIIDEDAVFWASNEAEAQEIADMLLNAAEENPFAPEFQLPFGEGAYWALFPGIDVETTTFWRWNAHEESVVSVPAGEFTGCYRMSYQTNPDITLRWVCPGQGLVAEEYIHGAYYFRSELVQFKSGEN